MKLAVTLFNKDDIKSLVEKANVDIFILGNEAYSNRLVNSFSDTELQETCEQIKSFGKEAYIEMNLIVHNNDLSRVSSYLDFINTIKVDGIIFSDLAVYNIAKRKGLEGLLIYNPETLITNYYDPIFWSNKGIKGVTISKEITLEDITKISEKSEIDISIIGHGHLNMFHSRRPLIENYFKYNETNHKEYVENRNLHLVEEIRNESYPVFQDNHGTHIFRDKIMKSYKELYQLDTVIDVFIIDGIFKDSKYLLETACNYRNILNDTNRTLNNTMDEKYKEGHDSGFLHKKTVYDKY